MSGKSTYEALMRRGIDSNLSQDLVNKNFTIDKLKLKSKEELVALGLNKDQAENLLDEKRPPIPEDIFYLVLHKSKNVCCICRNKGKGIIIHHIKKWANSKDHEIDNLVVLCLEHHGEAHTTRELSQNLDAKKIKSLRDIWYEKTENADSLALVNRANEHYAHWDYFNHMRLIEIMSSIERFTCIDKPGFQGLLAEGIIDDRGIITRKDCLVDGEESMHMYNSGLGLNLYDYHKHVFEELFTKLPIKNISEMSKSQVDAIVKEGDIISRYGNFYFKNQDLGNRRGIGQMVRCHNKGEVKIDCFFDSWECTSTSSWGGHLTGQGKVMVIAKVRTIEKKDSKTILYCSCLAIGGDFEDNYLF